MEADAVRPALNAEQFVLWESVTLTRQVASAKDRDDTSNIGLKGKHGQVHMQLDMIVKIGRYARGFFEPRHRSRKLCSQLQAPFDLTNLVSVLSHGLLV